MSTVILKSLLLFVEINKVMHARNRAQIKKTESKTPKVVTTNLRKSNKDNSQSKIVPMAKSEEGIK